MGNEVLSIVYSRLTGEIYLCNRHSSPQSILMFGKFQEEFSQVFEVLNIQYNEFIYKNKEQFKVNLETKELEMKPMPNTLGEIQYI